MPDSLFIKAVYPHGGEAFYVGSVAFIRWACGVPVGQTAVVKLELSISGASGPWSEIASAIPNSGRYQWLIPTGISSNNCYIRYKAATATDTAYGQTPAAFRILPIVAVQENRSVYPGCADLKCPTLIIGSAARFDITTPGPGNAHLSVYDCLGSRVCSLFKTWGSIRMTVSWDRTGDNGDRAPAGIYYAVLEGGDYRISRKIILLNP